jgi:hypothetical protein
MFQLGTDEDDQFAAALARRLGGSEAGAFLVTPTAPGRVRPDAVMFSGWLLHEISLGAAPA